MYAWGCNFDGKFGTLSRRGSSALFKINRTLIYYNTNNLFGDGKICSRKLTAIEAATKAYFGQQVNIDGHTTF